MDEQTPVNSANALEGALEFYSETGTEGGYWAFQDKKFITPNTTLFTCKKCGLMWDKEKDSSDHLKNATGKASFKTNVFCPPEEHEFNLSCPNFHSYEGLHVLKNGDHLTIYCEEDPERVLWSGVISLKQHPLFTQDAFGFWIHADQEGMDREAWATYFFKNYPAKLIPFKKTAT